MSGVRVCQGGQERDHIQGKKPDSCFQAFAPNPYNFISFCMLTSLPPAVDRDSSVNLPRRRDSQPVLRCRHKNQGEQGINQATIVGKKRFYNLLSPDAQYVQREDGGIVGQPVRSAAYN